MYVCVKMLLLFRQINYAFRIYDCVQLVPLQCMYVCLYSN